MSICQDKFIVKNKSVSFHVVIYTLFTTENLHDMCEVMLGRLKTQLNPKGEWVHYFCS